MAANKESMRCAFLIEGMRSPKTTPEISSAKALAKANSGDIFDPIVSYSPVHLGRLLQTLPKEEWPRFALCCLVYFSAEGSGIDIIEHTVKSGLNYLIEQQIIETLPKWLTDLTSEESIANFAKEQMTENFSNDRDKMTVYLAEMNNKTVALSNALSAEKFLEFILDNQNIDIIYGLIGDAHIGFIDEATGVQVIQQTHNYRHIDMKFQNKIITIKLFGGVHWKKEHFYRLQSECEKDGLVIPALPEQEPDIDMQLLLAMCNLMGNLVIEDAVPSDKITPQNEIAQPQSLTFFDTIHHSPQKSAKPSAANSDTEINASRDSAPSDKMETECKEFDLEEVVIQFDQWMKNHSHFGSTDTECTIKWLYCDYGGEKVSNYEDFCCFIDKLKTMGYDIPQIPSETDFQEGILECKRQPGYWLSKETDAENKRCLVM